MSSRKAFPFRRSIVQRTGATGSHMTPLGAGCDFVGPGMMNMCSETASAGGLISTIIIAARQFSILSRADGDACAVWYVLLCLS